MTATLAPRSFFGVWLVLALAPACAPEIGDECETAFDCSSQASRLCDRTQPGGYCTIRGCEPGTCPEEAVCVKFRPAEERLAVTYCMAECEEDDDCRSDEGYECTSTSAFGNGSEAVILGRNRKFCTIPALESTMPPVEAACAPDQDAAADASAGMPGDAGCAPSSSTRE